MDRRITEDERALLTHVSRWGTSGYPIVKLRASRWTWGPFLSVKGPPTVFPTKRAAVQSFEAFLGVLRAAVGQEAYERTIRERGPAYTALAGPCTTSDALLAHLQRLADMHMPTVLAEGITDPDRAIERLIELDNAMLRGYLHGAHDDREGTDSREARGFRALVRHVAGEVHDSVNGRR